MQTCHTIFTGSGGWKCIRAGTVSYRPASYGVVNHRINGTGVPRCHDNGIASTGTPAFRHPGRKGIIITILREAWLVPGTAVEAVARGAMAETGMQQVEWRGPVS